jgi:CubicO group peptidase (beta-lactamase class C family)
VVYTKGVRKYGESAAIDAATPMRLSSNTKAFTALAILRLVSEGRLALTDTLGDIFSSAAPAADPSIARREGTPIVIPATAANHDLASITVMRLLQMQSGIAAGSSADRCESYSNWVTRYTDYNVVRGLVRRDASDTSYLDGAEAFRYCNANYAILSVVAERKSGHTFESAVADITARLGMTETGIIDYAFPSVSTLPRASDKVWGHTIAHDATVTGGSRPGFAIHPTNADDQYDVGIVGDGEVWTTANDIGKWLDYWMTPTAASTDDAILGRAIYDANAGSAAGHTRTLGAGETAPAGWIHLKEAAYTAVGSAGAGYAFAWTRYGDYYSLGKQNLIAHGGATDGFRSTVEFYPYPAAAEDRAGFALLSNYHYEDDTVPEYREQFRAAEGLFKDLATHCP